MSLLQSSNPSLESPASGSVFREFPNEDLGFGKCRFWDLGFSPKVLPVLRKPGIGEEEVGGFGEDLEPQLGLAMTDSITPAIDGVTCNDNIITQIILFVTVRIKL